MSAIDEEESCVVIIVGFDIDDSGRLVNADVTDINMHSIDNDNTGRFIIGRCVVVDRREIMMEIISYNVVLTDAIMRV